MKAVSLKRLFIAAVVSSAWFSVPSWAYTINISVAGSKITYENAYSVGSGNNVSPMVLSDWQAVESLTPTNQWQPGLMTTTSNTLVASGAGGSFSVPISLLGAEYNSGGRVSMTESDPIRTGTACRSAVAGQIVSLYQTSKPTNGSLGFDSNSCVSSFSLKMTDASNADATVQPFYFVRPVFSIDEDALLQALSGVSPTGGSANYVGSMSTTLRYYFMENGILTYRNVATDNITVNISYIPSILNEVIVEQPELMPDYYDTVNHLTNGKAVFKVTAKGYFSTGVKLTFPQRDYKMKFITPLEDSEEATDGTFTTDKTIPYYIRCASCDVQSIVEDGELQLQNANSRAPFGGLATSYLISEPLETLNFDLDIGYTDIRVEDIESGFYSDTFTVLFEAIY